MKHLGLLKQVLLLFALIVGSTSVWGQNPDVTVTFASPVNLSNGELTNFSNDNGNLSITTNKNDAANPPAISSSQLRLYSNKDGGNGCSVTIASANKKMAKIVFTFSGDTYSAGTGSVTPDTYSVSGSTGTWTGSSHSVTMQNKTTTTSQIRISKIEIYYEAQTITNLSYSGTPTKTTYNVGESFDPTGLTVTATYDDSSSEDVTSSVVWTPDPMTVGTTSVTGTYMGLTVIVSGLTVNNVAKITITQDNLTGFTNTYKWYDWSSGGVSGKAFAYKNSGMQFNSTKDGYWIYNTTPIPGTITSVKMVKASGTDRSWTLKAGTSEISSTDGGTQIGNAQTVGTSGATWDVTGSYNYFLLYVSGGSTVISSIEITYSASTDPIINANATVELAANATSGEIAYSITNSQSGTSLTATSEADWISDITVGTEKVTFTTTANTTGNERSATITLTYGSVTKNVTVTQAKPVVTVNYSLATAIVPGKHYIITSGTDGEILALGKQTSNYREEVPVNATDGSLSVEDNAGVYEFLINVDNATGFYTLYDVANEKYLYANSNSSNNINVEASLDKYNNGVWAIEISSNGVATIKAQGANSHNWIRYNSNDSRFSCYGEINTMADVYLFERDNDESPVQTTITISPAADKTYTTFCRAIDLDFTNVSGIEAYIVSGLTESSASIKKVNKVPAGEGIILKRTGTDESFDIPFAESAEPIAKNYMVGVTKEKDMTNVTNAYILSGGLFYECSGGKLAAGKAYLNDEDGVWAAAAGAPSFSIIVDGETTGIENVKGEAITNSQYYTLDGRRVAAPTKGIYIVNGKKVVVK